jgi:hypothetical protein
MPTYTTDHRGQIRILSGDGATTADKLQFARDSSGTGAFVELVNATDAQTIAAKTLTSPTIASQLDTSGTSPTLAALAAAGSTAAITGQVGNDTSGTFTLTPGGAGIAAGEIITITFAAARPDTNFSVFLTPHSAAARTLPTHIGPSNRATTSVGLTTSTALTSGSAYIWGYLILGH